MDIILTRAMMYLIAHITRIFVTSLVIGVTNVILTVPAPRITSTQ
jgi:hypothetical protein